jgi:DNA-binding Xre family transcriptional regulator
LSHPFDIASDAVVEVFVDLDLAKEAFTYRLRRGGEGSVHLEQVLDFNKDPSYLRDLMVYQLTIAAQKRVAESSLSKREIVRRLGTSPAQLYRLLDQTNYAKTVDQLLRLLSVLDCNVELVVHAKTA